MEMVYDNKQERRLALSFLLVALLSLLIGALPGILQALEHAQIIPVPSASLYYQGLTVHGLLLAVVWTTFFASSFLLIATTHSLGRGLRSPILSWLAFGLMVIGTALCLVAIILGNSSVLYTAELPLIGSPLYYIGFILLIVGTWLHSINHFLTWSAWRKDNPTVRTPLAAFGSLASWILWDMATIGVLLEMLAMALPLSLGAAQTTNPLLGHTLFWFFGNGLEFFALLPAYVSWFAMMPRQAGGKLYSDKLARIVFILFLVFAIPSGLQRQFIDPGISSGLKSLHFIFALLVALPALITAFVTMASLEYAGKSRGGRGLIGWVFRLPWTDPGFTAQFLALTIFALAAIAAVIGTSYTMALVVDNTTWEAGQLHLTLGTAAALTFMGITYWLIPYLTQRRLVSRGLAIVQAWLWFFGVLIFSRGMGLAGLLGAPRRTPFSLSSLPQTLAGVPEIGPGGNFQISMILVAVGGLIMALSGLLYSLNIVATLVGKKDTEVVYDVPLAESLDVAEAAPAALDRWRLWVGVAVVVILIAYVPTILNVLQVSGWNTPGFVIH